MVVVVCICIGWRQGESHSHQCVSLTLSYKMNGREERDTTPDNDPGCQYASMPVCRYAGMPVCRFTRYEIRFIVICYFFLIASKKMEFIQQPAPITTDITGSSSKPLVAKKSPTDFLKQVIGKPVVVKLHSGVTYRGILACLDGFMNIAMEQTEEYIDGQMKNKYGDCFIRGNNGKSSLTSLP